MLTGCVSGWSLVVSDRNGPLTLGGGRDAGGGWRGTDLAFHFTSLHFTSLHPLRVAGCGERTTRFTSLHMISLIGCDGQADGSGNDG